MRGGVGKNHVAAVVMTRGRDTSLVWSVRPNSRLGPPGRKAVETAGLWILITEQKRVNWTPQRRSLERGIGCVILAGVGKGVHRSGTWRGPQKIGVVTVANFVPIEGPIKA